MMENFYNYLNMLPLQNQSQILGYSENELIKIERLYDIKFRGEFREFMLNIGRCDGGLIGDDPIILYRSLWSVRAQILFQIGLYESLQDIQAHSFLRKKPFVFSWEAESQMIFILTDSDENVVYSFDENEEVINNTKMTFSEYLVDVLKRYSLPNESILNNISKGELILI